MSAVEFQRADVHETFPKAPLIVREFLFRIQIVCRPASDKRRRYSLQNVWRDLGRYVATDSYYACHPGWHVDRGAKRHRDSLRKSCEHDARQRRPLCLDRFDARGHVRSVIGDCEFTILPRHPARYHSVCAPLVKAVQRLYRYDKPSIASRNGAKAFQLRFRVLAISMESDQQRSRSRCRRWNNEITAVCSGCCSSFDHVVTLTRNHGFPLRGFFLRSNLLPCR